MAEVLITLGIIGVVAALTMPTLITNFQKKVLINQLQKQISVINNNFEYIKSTENALNISETSIAKKYNNEYASINNEAYKNYFKLNEIDIDNSHIFKKAGVDKALITKDGAILVFNKIYGEASLAIDINGNKKPNTGGRDIFYMLVSNQKGITNMSLDTEENRSYCVELIKYKTEDITEKLTASLLAGNLCYTKILHDGWEMNY